MRQGSLVLPFSAAVGRCVFSSSVSLLLVLVAMAVPVKAGEVLDTSFLERSEWVFHGRLVRKDSYPSQDGRLILTRYSFAVESTIRGNHRDLAEVVEYGGRVGEKTLFVSHTASFRLGGEYLLFLVRDSHQRFRTSGGSEGRLEILRGPQDEAFLKLYRQHSIRAWFPEMPAGLVPLAAVLEVVSLRLGGIQ